MIIFADILVSLVMIAVGYVAVCYYFNNKTWNSGDITSLKLSKNKIGYLIATTCISTLLIVFFHVVYDLKIMTQIKLLLLVLILFPIAVVDFRIQRIPNQYLIAALGIRCFLYIPEIAISPQDALLVFIDNMLGAILIAGFFLLLLFVFKNSIGMGDIKLFFVMGMYQGLWGTVNSVFFSLVVSFFASLILLIARKKKRTDTIAFGPSILVGTIIAICLSGM